MTTNVRPKALSYACGASSIPLLGKTIGYALDESAEKYSQNDALVVCHQKRRYTYQTFREEVELAARGFVNLGIQKGDRVGIWSTNRAEWVLTQFATAKIGAILVSINPLNRSRELEYVLRQSECQTLVMIRGFRDFDYPGALRQICPEIDGGCLGDWHAEKLPNLRNVIFLDDEPPSGMLAWDDLMRAGRGVSLDALREREATLDFDDAINIQYTSGTTGFPKGATLSHHNLVNNGRLIADAMRFDHNDRLCIPVPLYHCFGQVLANMACVTTGATMVLPAAYFEPEATLRAVQQERCTALHGVPTMFIAELDHPKFAEFDLRTLRTGIMSGAPCPIEVMKRVVGQMHCGDLTIAYGMTEASPVITQTRVEDSIELRVTSVGKPLPHTEVKIVDRSNGEIVPISETGELCARGYLVMKGYYRDEEATRRAIDGDGWLHTGDLATMDPNGYCKITGRAKDMIIRGGSNISPREIEEFIYTCPGVVEVQVVGIPDRKYGEQVVAWVKLDESASLSPEDIRVFCKGSIADYKVPRHVKVVKEFPLTVTGKVQKFKIREIMTQELGLNAEAEIETA
jgi:fatty-acyl-CoA synthase